MPFAQKINIPIIRLYTGPRYRYEGAADRAVAIAEHYGFRLIPAPKLSRDNEMEQDGERQPEERIALLRTFVEQKLEMYGSVSQLVYVEKVPYRPLRRVHLAIIGNPAGAAEGILLHTATTILNEYGMRELSVEVNSVGERDSLAAFVREVMLYYRKHVEELGAHGKEHAKNNLAEFFGCTDAACSALRENAPQILSFLSEGSRRHFRDVLEYFEALEIPYRINHYLVPDHPALTRTVFEIRNGTETLDNPTACPRCGYGGRFDALARRAGFGRHIPTVFATLELSAESGSDSHRLIKEEQPAQPHAFIAQMGADAKRTTLRTLELLRKAHIAVTADLHHDTMAYQIEHAERIGVPILIIIGQKEALEMSAIVRHLDTHVQTVVPLNALATYLKRRTVRT